MSVLWFGLVQLSRNPINRVPITFVSENDNYAPPLIADVCFMVCIRLVD